MNDLIRNIPCWPHGLKPHRKDYKKTKQVFSCQRSEKGVWPGMAGFRIQSRFYPNPSQSNPIQTLDSWSWVELDWILSGYFFLDWIAFCLDWIGLNFFWIFFLDWIGLDWISGFFFFSGLDWTQFIWFFFSGLFFLDWIGLSFVWNFFSGLGWIGFDWVLSGSFLSGLDWIDFFFWIFFLDWIKSGF